MKDKKCSLSPLFILVFVFLFLVFIRSELSANGMDVQLIPGNTVIPLKQEKIRMLNELINAEDGVLTALFTFKNESTDHITSKMGFPFKNTYESTFFKVKVDEIEKTTSRHIVTENKALGFGAEYDFAYIWDVSFAPGQTIVVQCKYKTQWASEVLGTDERFLYITKTGALWNGTIEKADFRIQLPSGYKYFTIDASPKEYIVNNGFVEWHFTNWTPTEDIKISIEGRPPSLAEGSPYLVNFYDRKTYYGDSIVYTFQDLECDIKSNWACNSKNEKVFVQLLRNEIFARKGRRFKSENIRSIFEGTSWYKHHPLYSDDMLNDIERKNIKFIVDYEKKKGWR